MCTMPYLGACPPEKFCKIAALRLNFRGILQMKMNEELVLFVNKELVIGYAKFYCYDHGKKDSPQPKRTQHLQNFPPS